MKGFFYGILIVILLLSGFKLGQRYFDEKKSEAAFQDAFNLVEDSKEIILGSSLEGDREETPLEYYESLLEVNNHVVGWIEIQGTPINYPVVQLKEEPDFYLTHGLDKKKSIHGVPYVDARVRVGESTNTIIYAHQMKDGTMFTGLNSYLDADFYQENPYILFNTLESFGKYEIISVFKTTNLSGEGFPYYNFIETQNEEEFDEFIHQVKELSSYDTRTSAVYGDSLLTLSTCEYTLQEGRLVVVAKKIFKQP